MIKQKSLVIIVLIVASVTNIVMIFHTVRSRSGTVSSVSTSPQDRHSSHSDVSDALRGVQDQDLAALNERISNLTGRLELQMSVISFLSQDVINNHNFSYVHNPVNTCSPGNIEVLFVIPSAPDNFENRDKVRKGSRASYIRDSKGRAKLLFFLGAKKRNETDDAQSKINEEALKYGDIVQDGFEDSYRNMRLKAVSMLKWASTFCGQAKYVIRTDDDVAVDPEKLVAALGRKGALFTDFILGQIAAQWEPIREQKNKYFLSKEEFPHSTLPPFALGGLLGYPMSTVRLLYQAALRMKPLWLDDVFITAICAKRVQVPLVQDPDFIFKHWAW